MTTTQLLDKAWHLLSTAPLQEDPPPEWTDAVDALAVAWERPSLENDVTMVDVYDAAAQMYCRTPGDLLDIDNAANDAVALLAAVKSRLVVEVPGKPEEAGGEEPPTKPDPEESNMLTRPDMPTENAIEEFVAELVWEERERIAGGVWGRINTPVMLLKNYRRLHRAHPGASPAVLDLGSVIAEMTDTKAVSGRVVDPGALSPSGCYVELVGEKHNDPAAGHFEIGARRNSTILTEYLAGRKWQRGTKVAEIWQSGKDIAATWARS